MRGMSAHSTDGAARFMSVPIVLRKEKETDRHCTYSFGAWDTEMGRVTLDKTSGDIEIARLEPTADAPNERYCLAQVVPRLQSYHHRQAYPASDEVPA